MQEANAVRDGLTQKFTESYMEKLFYFCLKKTGSQMEAEDLTQDIALQIIAALNKGMIPVSFSAWVWKIARNRYALWAKEKHTRNQSVTGSDIGDYELKDDKEGLLDEMIYAEQMALLRRELAFIRSDYRYIVVAYYIENKSIREIALSLSLAEGTVKSRLFRARELLKEGMNMAREFGKRSYDPENIAFVQNGRDGKKGQPWSIINHLLYKNIFLETYENPQTAEELSLELGVALPYLEDELEFLVQEQLLTEADGRYQTAFSIISREEQRSCYEKHKKIQKALTDKICLLIDTYMAEGGSMVDCKHIGYEAAKWALLVRAFDYLQHDAVTQRSSEEYKNNYPQRPDDGAWILTGYETIDWEKPFFVGQHGYLSYDKSEIKKDVDFGQFKFFYQNIQEKTPDHLTWVEAYTLWLFCNGRIEECEAAYLDKLVEYGYVKMVGSTVVPQVVIFDRNAEKDVAQDASERLAMLKEEICRLFRQDPDIERGYVVEQAIHDGWLKYDDDTIGTVGAYIYL